MTVYGRERWDGLQRIWWIIDQLRGDPGCPWDRRQTPESVQTYLIEEAHEAAAAVRAGRAQDAAEELGDLLFMVLFLVHLYEEGGHFGLDRVCELICEKMIRRHPHVFGDATVHSSEEVKDNWEKIKANEKASSGKASGKIPDSLPALMRAYRMLSRLSHQNGFERDNLGAEVARFASGSHELSRQLAAGLPASPELFGEVFLDLVNLARLQGIRSEDCLHRHLKLLEDSS